MIPDYFLLLAFCMIALQVVVGGSIVDFIATVMEPEIKVGYLILQVLLVVNGRLLTE